MKSTLYKKAKNEKLQQWIIEVKQNMYRTIEGFVGGAQSETAWTVCEGKNVGRSNETSPEEQAEKEVEARIKKQKDKGWKETQEEAGKSKLMIEPMLAKEYKDFKDYALTKSIATQPKLDGIRCIATPHGLFSRNGKPINTVPHIWKEVKKIFDDSSDQYFFLDGEIYNHELKEDFNKIASLVKNEKKAKENPDGTKEAQYHIYDIDYKDDAYGGEEPTFKERHEHLNDIFLQNWDHLIMVPTRFLIEGQQPHVVSTMIDTHYESYLEDGYEGIMIRTTSSLYQNKRTKDLLKRKEWIDGEFELVDIQEGRGNRAGYAARVICKDERGEEFEAGIIGNMEYCKGLLEDKSKYLGKPVTIKYQNLTPDRKVPRFGKMKTVRDYE